MRIETMHLQFNLNCGVMLQLIESKSVLLLVVKSARKNKDMSENLSKGITSFDLLNLNSDCPMVCKFGFYELKYLYYHLSVYVKNI